MNERRALPQNQEALVAVLNERFDAQDARLRDGQQQFELIGTKLTGVAAGQAELKEEILKNRSETASLTRRVETQNGNVADVVKKVAEVAAEVIELKKWKAEHTTEAETDHVALAGLTKEDGDGKVRFAFLGMQLRWLTGGVALTTTTIGILKALNLL